MKSFTTFRWMIFIVIPLFIIAGCSKNTNMTPPPAKTPGLQLVVDNLISPVAIAEPPDSSHRLFVVDELGQIWIIGADGKKLTTPFIDVSGKMVTIILLMMKEDCLVWHSLLILNRMVNFIFFIQLLHGPVHQYLVLRVRPGIILQGYLNLKYQQRIQIRRT